MSIKKSKTAKVVAGLLGLSMIFGVVGVTPAAAQSSDTTAQINALLAQVAALSAQLAALQSGGTTTTTTTTTSCSFVFTSDLSAGKTSSDVKNLQAVLNSSADTQVAASGVGSAGNESNYFGGLTKAAVIKFQAKHGISPAAGYVGPITRAKLNALCTTTGGTTTTTTGTTGGTTGGGTTSTGAALTVASASQPGASLAPQSAARVPFTRITLSAGSSDVVVNSITVERTGLAQDAVFAGVVLLDETGTQIGIAKTLNSNHQVAVGEAFTVKAGTTKTLTIAGNMASSLSSYSGQVVSLSVVGVNTTATVSGALPITGASHTVNSSLSLGSATANSSSFDPGASASKEIGTVAYKFAGIRITAGSAEKIKLWSVRFNQSGSASKDDLGNVKVFVDGVAYDTVVSVDGKYYSASFGTGILVDKGSSKDIYVEGDIVGSGSAGRTVKFDIYKTTDVYVTGETYGYGITPTAGSTGTASVATTEFTTGTPWFDASQVTVLAGSITTVAKSTAVAAQNVSVNVPNQVLGGFDTDVKGEPISIQSLVFTVATSGASVAGGGLLTNVTIVDQNGAVVAGPVDATDATPSDANQTLTFTDTITLPVGKRTYTLKGKIASTVPNNTVYTVTTVPSSGWTNVTGQTTGNTITLTNGTFSMNPVTVKAASLAISVSSDPSAQTIVAGGTARTFANYQLDASQSGEDIRFSSIPLLLAGSGTATNVTGCQLFDSGNALNTGTNVVNPSAAGSNTFTFDGSLTVPKGTVKTLTLKCNVSGSASGTYQWGIAASPSITVTGVISSNDVTETVTASAGQLQTISTSSLVISNGDGNGSYVVAAAGTTGVTAGKIKFRASNEAVNLERVGLILTNTASSSASDLIMVSLWDGATKVGSAVFTGANRVATSTLTSTIVLPKNADKELTVKLDLANIGSDQPGAEGALIAVDYNSNDTTGTRGTGVESGVQVNATGSSSLGSVRMFKTFPTFALDTLPSNGVADGRLMRFKVTADAKGSVGLYKFTVTLATTSATVTGVNIYAFDNSAYSGSGVSLIGGGQLEASNVSPNSSGVSEIYVNTAADAVSRIQVGAGQTTYFEVRGTVTGAATTYSVTTTLEGDSAYPALSTLMATAGNVDADASNDDFIWSPNATTTANVSTDNDWTNGFGLAGLPSNGIIQTRSN